MPTCLNCRRDNPSDSRFCGGCGAVLVTDPPTPTAATPRTTSTLKAPLPDVALIWTGVFAVVVLGLGGLVANGFFMEPPQSPPQTIQHDSAREPAPSLARAARSGNLAHDILSALPEDRRRANLALVVRSVGESCTAATRTFFQGFAPGKDANWSVTCNDGRSYSVTIKNDSTGSTVVLGCDVMKALAHSDCFKPY